MQVRRAVAPGGRRAGAGGRAARRSARPPARRARRAPARRRAGRRPVPGSRTARQPRSACSSPSWRAQPSARRRRPGPFVQLVGLGDGVRGERAQLAHERAPVGLLGQQQPSQSAGLREPRQHRRVRTAGGRGRDRSPRPARTRTTRGARPTAPGCAGARPPPARPSSGVRSTGSARRAARRPSANPLQVRQPDEVLVGDEQVQQPVRRGRRQPQGRGDLLRGDARPGRDHLLQHGQRAAHRLG